MLQHQIGTINVLPRPSVMTKTLGRCYATLIPRSPPRRPGVRLVSPSDPAAAALRGLRYQSSQTDKNDDQVNKDTVNNEESSASFAANGPPPPDPPYDVLFCGSDQFALSMLAAVRRREGLCRSIYILTLPDLAPDWGGNLLNKSLTKQYAMENGLSYVTPAPDSKGLKNLVVYHPNEDPNKPKRFELQSHLPEGQSAEDKSSWPHPFAYPSKSSLLLTASFGSLIPTPFLRHFTSQSPSLALNVHPSLLPKLRGAAPIPWAIAHGLATTGSTIQQLSEGVFDHGKILAQESLPIPDDATTPTLTSLLREQSASLLQDTIESLPKRHEAARSQDDKEATYARKITPEDLSIDPTKLTAPQIYARQRAFQDRGMLSAWLRPSPKPVAQMASIPPTVRVLLHDVQLVRGPLRALSKDAGQRLEPSPAGKGRLTLDAKTHSLIIKCKEPSLAEKVPDVEEQPRYIRCTSVHTENRPKHLINIWWQGTAERRDAYARLTFGAAVTKAEQLARIKENAELKVERTRLRGSKAVEVRLAKERKAIGKIIANTLLKERQERQKGGLEPATESMEEARAWEIRKEEQEKRVAWRALRLEKDPARDNSGEGESFFEVEESAKWDIGGQAVVKKKQKLRVEETEEQKERRLRKHARQKAKAIADKVTAKHADPERRGGLRAQIKSDYRDSDKKNDYDWLR